MESKIKIYRFITFFLGLNFLSLGIILILKSDFGISVLTSVPYVFSLRFQEITFGQWNYVAQVIVFFLMVLVLKKLKISYLISFAVSYFFGEILDLFNVIFSSVSPETLPMRIAVFSAGLAALPFGISMCIKSQYPILPFDIFVKEVSQDKNLSLGKCKTTFDLTFLTISLISSFMFFKEIKGIYWGTLISALLTGTLVKFFLKVQNSLIQDVELIDKNKADIFLEHDLLKYLKNPTKKEYP